MVENIWREGDDPNTRAKPFKATAVGEALFARRGRIPSRPDVETNPPGVLKALQQRKVMPIALAG